MAEPTPPTTGLYNKTEQWLTRMEQMLRYNVTNVTSLAGTFATDNTFSSALNLHGVGKALVGLVPNPVFTGLVYVQVALSTATSPSTWYDLASYTTGAFKLVDTGVACSIRVGVKTGDYTSGTMAWQLRTGGRP